MSNFAASVTPAPPIQPLFCGSCGGRLVSRIPLGESSERLICIACNTVTYIGPSVSVLTLVFAQDRILLIKRGLPPDQGRWAPPGGFVEMGESLETAAVRELEEEVGIKLANEQLLPHAITSLPAINQICVTFLAVLERVAPLRPAQPEVLEANWFFESAYPEEDMWAPAMGVDIRQIFERVKTGRFTFYQQTDNSLRVISARTRIQYLWRKA